MINLQDVRNVSMPRCDLQSVPKFLLNLDRRPDRLSVFDDLLRKQNAAWMLEGMCRIPAPDGLRLNESISPLLVQPAVWEKVWAEKGSGYDHFGHGMTRGAAALIMGHALAWERVRQQSAPWSIVFEDDIGNLHPGIADFLCNILEGKEEALKDGWEYVQLQLDNKFKRNHDSPVHAVPGTDFNTGMYLITREAATRMMSLSFPVGDLQLDSHKGVLRKELTGFMAEPKAAEQIHLFAHDTDSNLSLERHGAPGKGIGDCGPLQKPEMVKPELLDALPA